jgi:hypothetical protein
MNHFFEFLVILIFVFIILTCQAFDFDPIFDPINTTWRFFNAGPCQECGQHGWKRFSFVDPCSPGLPVLCKQHHGELDEKLKQNTFKK